MRLKILAGSITLSLFVLSTAIAQTTAPPAAGSPHAIPEKQAAPLNAGRSDSLSQKLSNSDGVIKPNTNVDPGIRAPAPDPHPNSTPVIPPSATGGENAK